MSKTIFLFIPNYVYSSDLLRTDFITLLSERFRVCVFLPHDPSPYPKNERIIYIPWSLQFPEFWTFWGKSVRVPLIRMFDHEPLIQRNYQLSFGHWKRKVLRRVAFLFPKYFWNPDFIARLELFFISSSPRFEEYVRRYQPALVVTPTPGFTELDAEAIILARRYGIYTVAMNFSWDNLTSNCKHFRKTNYLICWTDELKHQAVSIHSFPAERVFVSGIMRFDHYFRDDPHEKTREEFLRSLGLNPSEKTILVSTVTKGNYKDEPMIVEVLLRARREKRFQGFPNIFIRLHPKQDTYDEFLPFTKEPGVHVELAGKKMARHLGARIEMDMEDLINLKDTLRHIDVVVNYASTITLEACIFNKPVVNIGFPPYYMNAYSFTHYKPVVELGAVRVAKSAEELIGEVASYLRDPSRDTEGRRRVVSSFIGFTDAKSFQRCVRYLETIVNALS